MLPAVPAAQPYIVAAVATVLALRLPNPHPCPSPLRKGRGGLWPPREGRSQPDWSRSRLCLRRSPTVRIVCVVCAGKVPLRGTCCPACWDQAAHLFEVACMVFRTKLGLRPTMPLRGNHLLFGILHHEPLARNLTGAIPRSFCSSALMSFLP